MATLDELFPGEVFEPVKKKYYGEAKKHLDQLTKPVGSLGELENVAMRLYAIGNGRMPIRIDPAILYTIAGDHGIAAQKVSPFPQAVTRQMVHNFLAGGAAINVLCRASRITQKIVDAGCAGGTFKPHPMLIDLHMGPGTADISQGAAMTTEICEAALRAGLALALGAAQNGFACIGTGEMGIANSTTAGALYCAFLDLEPDDVAGPGAGANQAMIKHKSQMIAKALAANASAVDSGDPLRILAALGGYEIAVLAGLMLGCASQNMPFIVDGYICMSAYVAACAFFADLPDYGFLSHISGEPGIRKVLEKLKPRQKPLLDLEMRLGEGTGAALAMPLLRSAAALFNEMATFESAGVQATPGDRIS